MFQASYNVRYFVPDKHCESLLKEYGQDKVEGFLETYRQGVSCSASDLRCYGKGAGLSYQRLAKAKPDFAAEFTAVGLRAARRHWGPLNRRQVEVRPEVVNLLTAVHVTLREEPSGDSSALVS